VWKFGGTSVADHARLRAAAERMVAAQRAGHQVVATLSAMGKSTDELSAMAYAMSARPPLRELDVLLSVGESASCALASIAVAELGSRAVSLNGPQAGIQTDVNHGNARVTAVEPRRIREALADGSIVLVTGFQGMSASGDVTTEEMLEMAEAGAAVIQPRSVELAVTYGVDIHLRSSFSTDDGTWIGQAEGRFEGRGTCRYPARSPHQLRCKESS
jgi:aspartate kinase